MARTLALAAFLVAITCVVADSNDTLVPTPSATPMPVPSTALASSSAGVTTSTVTPQPVYPSDNWILEDSNGDACIRLEAKISVNVTFDAVDNGTAKVDSKSFNVSKYAAVYTSKMQHKGLPNVSHCDANSNVSVLTLIWNNSETQYYLLSFQFRRNASKLWELYKVALSFDTDNGDFPTYMYTSDYNSILAVLSQQLAVAKSEQAYMCNAEERLGLAVDTNHTLNITMMLKDLKVQAFSFSKNNTFDSAADCEQDHHHSSSGNNKIVPIAVGAALAGLVIIVLIAYLIGRFRSRKSSSYEPLS